MAKTLMTNGARTTSEFLEWAAKNPEDEAYCTTGRKMAVAGAAMIACGLAGRMHSHTTIGKLASHVAIVAGWLFTGGGGCIMGATREAYLRDLCEKETELEDEEDVDIEDLDVEPETEVENAAE